MREMEMKGKLLAILLLASLTLSVASTVVAQISATVDFKPETLNLKSKGKYVTVFIELPEGYNVSDIDVSSILLNDTVPALPKPVNIGDEDGDGAPDLMVKFSRAEVKALFPGPGTYTVKVTGTVGAETFVGYDEVRVK